MQSLVRNDEGRRVGQMDIEPAFLEASHLMGVGIGHLSWTMSVANDINFFFFFLTYLTEKFKGRPGLRHG